MSRLYLLVVSSIILFASQGATAQEKAEKKSFTYGGVATCKACHLSKKSGAQYKIWADGPHAKALETLKSEKALAIAKEKGIADPATSEKCLKCHVTAFGVDKSLKGPKLTMEESISCEACHGPGSAYKGRKVMLDLWAGKLKAEDYGLVKPVTEEVCKTCHNEESPTYTKFVFKERYAKIAHPVPEK